MWNYIKDQEAGNQFMEPAEEKKVRRASHAGFKGSQEDRPTCTTGVSIQKW